MFAYNYNYWPYDLGYLLGYALIRVIIGIFSVSFIVYLIARILLFRKAERSGFLAIVPFYGDYVFTVKICGLHWAWYLGSLLSGLLIIITGPAGLLIRFFVKAMSFYNLAKKCRRDPIPSMIFGSLFPKIVTMVFGFGLNPYDELVEVKKSGVF